MSKPDLFEHLTTLIRLNCYIVATRGEDGIELRRSSSAREFHPRFSRWLLLAYHHALRTVLLQLGSKETPTTYDSYGNFPTSFSRRFNECLGLPRSVRKGFVKALKNHFSDSVEEGGLLTPDLIREDFSERYMGLQGLSSILDQYATTFLNEIRNDFSDYERSIKDVPDDSVSLLMAVSAMQGVWFKNLAGNGIEIRYHKSIQGKKDVWILNLFTETLKELTGFSNITLVREERDIVENELTFDKWIDNAMTYTAFRGTKFLYVLKLFFRGFPVIGEQGVDENLIVSCLPGTRVYDWLKSHAKPGILAVYPLDNYNLLNVQRGLYPNMVALVDNPCMAERLLRSYRGKAIEHLVDHEDNLDEFLALMYFNHFLSKVRKSFFTSACSKDHVNHFIRSRFRQFSIEVVTDKLSGVEIPIYPERFKVIQSEALPLQHQHRCFGTRYIEGGLKQFAVDVQAFRNDYLRHWWLRQISLNPSLFKDESWFDAEVKEVEVDVAERVLYHLDEHYFGLKVCPSDTERGEERSHIPSEVKVKLVYDGHEEVTYSVRPEGGNETFKRRVEVKPFMYADPAVNLHPKASSRVFEQILDERIKSVERAQAVADLATRWHDDDKVLREDIEVISQASKLAKKDQTALEIIKDVFDVNEPGFVQPQKQTTTSEDIERFGVVGKVVDELALMEARKRVATELASRWRDCKSFKDDFDIIREALKILGKDPEQITKAKEALEMVEIVTTVKPKNHRGE